MARALTWRISTLTLALATVVTSAAALAAGPAQARPLAARSGCPAPQAAETFATAGNVGASFATSGTTATYSFTSFVDEHPANGVPGLIKYCVYTSPQPSAVNATAQGANGAQWISRRGLDSFAFMRPGGNATNIPLDGTTTEVGTAAWSAAPPTDQLIILHINDPAECARLYGGDPGTCFVKPGEPPTVCPSSSPQDSHVVYTAMPVDVLKCASMPSFAFEAQSTSEFGDEVGLSQTGTLSTLRVMFASYGCSVSGHWFSGDCVTTPGATFSHPITANIYAVDNSGPTPKPGALLATVTQTFTIAYRPSADAVNCTGADAGKWFNTDIQACEFKIRQLLTFTFPGGTQLPSQVIWTVAYNTTHYGYAPIGEGAACFSTAQGCGYDSLNVATSTYPGAPYVGIDVDPNGAFLNSSSSGAYCDGGAGGTGTLRLDTAATDCWADFKPLGEVSIV